MKRNFLSMNRRMIFVCSVLGGLLFVSACKKNVPSEHKLRHFDQINLVANKEAYGAPHLDSSIINAWGIAFNPTGVAWVNSQGGHVSALFTAEGVQPRKPVWIPGPADNVPGNPSGIVFNAGTGFGLSNGNAARFLFVGVDGVVSGWNPAAGDTALIVANHSATSAYTGLALVVANGNTYLYAADFRGGKIETWDDQFNPVSLTFADPSLPAGYSPFNIQLVGDWLYVTYAKPGPDGRELLGDGLGIVNIFKTNGELVKRFASGGALNAPWGVTAVEPGFFRDNDDDTLSKAAMSAAENMILLGNFGNGRINVYTASGKFVGPLKSRGQPISIPGLWAITFPPATSTIDPDRLYFAAGPAEEGDGLFGYIQKQ